MKPPSISSEIEKQEDHINPYFHTIYVIFLILKKEVIMDKLALGMALVCLIYIVFVLAISYLNGLLEEWKWNRKRDVPNFLKILKKDSFK